MATDDSAVHLVDGQWCTGDGAEHLQLCPWDTRRTLLHFQEGAVWMDRAMESARKAQRVWAARPLSQRLQALDLLGECLHAHRATISRTIVDDIGKVQHEADAEAAALAAKWDVTRELAPAALSPRRPTGVAGYWDRVPLGVIGVLGPFNFPVHLSNGHILPALAAGNAVILKPSEVAPGSAAAWARAFLEACALSPVLDPRLVQVVQGGAATGQALVEHPGLDGLAFTGSRNVGVGILRTLAERPHVLTALEMGGKNPVIVLGDADLELATEKILFSALASTGQRCTAASRVLVDQSIAQALIDHLAAGMRQWAPGDPRSAGPTTLGPLATAAAQTRFQEAQESRDGLHTIVEGGAAEGPTPGHWVRPSLHIVQDIEASRARWSEELFGPELLLERVSSVEEALYRANATRYGLATSVFTRSSACFRNLRNQLHFGLIHHNQATVGASARLPFGGAGDSGNHRPAAALSFDYVTRAVATLEG